MDQQQNCLRWRTRLSVLKSSDRILSFVICGVVLLTHGCTQPKLRVGSLAPAIGLEQLLHAPPEAVADWDSLKGKVVVLEFWATWCGPCVAAIPHLNELVDEFKDKPIQFISITDEDSKTIESFLRKRPLKSWVGLDTNGSMFKAYGVQGLPHTVVVDKNGRIAAITSPTALNEQNLNDFLSGKNTIPQRPQGMQRGYVFAGVEPHDSNRQPVLYQDDRVSIRPTNEEWGGTVRSWGKLTIKGGTVKMAISSAYGRPTTRIVCPAHLDEDRYTFVVSLPKQKSDQFESVFQDALTVAFDFAVRHERRELDVYVLGVPDGAPPKLHEAAGGTYSMNSRRGKLTMLTMVNAELDALAPFLEGELDKPVIDDTNISGQFDFDLKYETDNAEALIGSVREQLGLELRLARREVEVLVVELRRND